MTLDAAEVAASLTVRQHAALLLHDVHGELNEGLIAELYPLIADGRGARQVARGLERKALVTFGQWWDEGAAYELLLTDLGRAVLDKIVMRLLHERLALLNKLKLEKD